MDKRGISLSVGAIEEEKRILTKIGTLHIKIHSHMYIVNEAILYESNNYTWNLTVFLLLTVIIIIIVVAVVVVVDVVQLIWKTHKKIYDCMCFYCSWVYVTHLIQNNDRNSKDFM